MRVLVTGAAGFIGSHLCEALLAAGHEVLGIDCFTDYYSKAEKDANLQRALASPTFRFEVADLRVDPLAGLMKNVDAVVNEAATPGLVRSWTSFDEYQSTNFTAVMRLLDACIAAGVSRFVQASTSSVYGVNAAGDEDSPVRPVSPYGVTKLAAEHLLRAYSASHGLELTVLRYFSVYGPRQRPDMAYRIFCEKMLAGEPIVVYGDGNQSRSNTYIDDCVGATVASLDSRAIGETFNVGGGGEIRLGEAIRVLSDHFGVTPVVEYAPVRPGDQFRTVADVRRIGSVLGWQPRVNPQVGLIRQAEWVADWVERRR